MFVTKCFYPKIANALSVFGVSMLRCASDRRSTKEKRPENSNEMLDSTSNNKLFVPKFIVQITFG